MSTTSIRRGTAVVVRAAREDDLDGVARVLAAAFEEHRPAGGASTDPRYRDAFERYFEEIVNVRGRLEDAEIFVAEEDGRVLGTGTIYPPGRGARYARATSARPWPEDWASLRLLAVHPARRRRGIGRMLLEARVSRARALGAPFVALHTAEPFADARRLVLRAGWARYPEFDHAPAPGVCAEAYVLPLR